MKWIHNSSLFIAVVLLAGCAVTGDTLEGVMTGTAEVPPVATSALGSGTFHVGFDRSVSGTFRTKGATITAAHIHEGAVGANGPVIIPLQKSGDDEWVVPAGSKFTEPQYKSFKAGNIYVNFHSAKHKGGELRAQLRPEGTTK